MKKLRIGYQALSGDLSHPGDRRRVVFWAKHRGHQIITDFQEQVDVFLLSERANFGLFPKAARGTPIIFDLIDGYLSSGNSTTDWVRGTSKVFTGQLTGMPKPFTSFVQNLCLNASAVICSSPEQRETIAPFSRNVHIILDSHDEFPLVEYGNTTRERNQSNQILWEGMPATLGGLKQIQPVLSALQLSVGLNINVVTDTTYFQLLGKYFRGETSSLLKRILEEMYVHSKIIPWSPGNLVTAAENSKLAVLPINLKSPLQYLKPENRLLIMWRLGLPCLTSPTPSYIRVTNDAETETICRSEEEWGTKLRLLLQNEDIAEDIVEKGQSYLRKYHNTDALLERWDLAFQSVL